jgi:NAD(P)-dependent dehydrogenase (short-subunit alcohol dehydrogenase family)
VGDLLGATVPTPIEQGTGGSAIMPSSAAGPRGLPFLAHCSASRHGVAGPARSMANELGHSNIRVNTVHPHGAATWMTVGPLLAGSATTLAPIFVQTLPDQVSQPEDMANAVAWLASDEARHVTGIQLPVDLGTLTR